VEPASEIWSQETFLDGLRLVDVPVKKCHLRDSDSGCSEFGAGHVKRANAKLNCKYCTQTDCGGTNLSSTRLCYNIHSSAYSPEYLAGRLLLLV
jgi:hypothetical protein